MGGGREGGKGGLTHARHGDGCARTHGKKERVRLVSKFLAGLLLHLGQGGKVLVLERIWHLPLGFEEIEACGGGDDKAGGHREAEAGHLAWVCVEKRGLCVG